MNEQRNYSENAVKETVKEFTKFIKENIFSHEYVNPNIVNAFARFFIDTKII